MERLKKIWNGLRPALTSTLILMLLCGLVFPLLLQGVSTLIFPHQAKGNLVEADGKKVGSLLVGQEFTKDYFMKGRPSAVHYNTYTEKDGEKVYVDGTPFGGVASGSANYGPSNPDLKARVETDIAAFLAAHPGVKREELPADLFTASGSGLDPHISKAAALLQLPAIAKASGLSEKTLQAIVDANTEGKLLGLFGEEKVHVLGVNIDIAEAMKA